MGYDPPSATMEAEFQTGMVYQYFDVPQTVFDGLLSASSVGADFLWRIRGVFRYARV